MPTLTAAQLALVQATAKEAVACVTIPLPTPLYYCTGDDPFTHPDTSNVHTPKVMRASPPPQDTISRAKWAIDILDTDATLYSDWRDNWSDWSGISVTFEVFYRLPSDDDRSWVECYSVAWLKTSCEYQSQSRWFRINMMGSAGLRPRAGLEEGSYTLFQYAPDPAKPIRISTQENSRSISFPSGHRSPPPPPGGQYVPPRGYDIRRDPGSGGGRYSAWGNNPVSPAPNADAINQEGENTA